MSRPALAVIALLLAAPSQAQTGQRTATPSTGLLWGSKMTVETQPCCTVPKGARSADRSEHRLRRPGRVRGRSFPQAPTGGMVARARLLRRGGRSLRRQHGLPDLGARRSHDTRGGPAGAVAIGPPCRGLAIQPDVRSGAQYRRHDHRSAEGARSVDDAGLRRCRPEFIPAAQASLDRRFARAVRGGIASTRRQSRHKAASADRRRRGRMGMPIAGEEEP